MKKAFLIISAFLLSLVTMAADVVWFDGQHPVTYAVGKNVDPVVRIALQMFCDDMCQVTGLTPLPSGKAVIKIIQEKGHGDGFSISVEKGQIVVRGENGRGTAYGILELSRMAGVSPWIWWGDVVPQRKQRLILSENFSIKQHPSVEYRGIFLNDEDWSLRNWRCGDEKSAPQGQIGVQTYKRIFQLMLRLRANAIWPAMHPGTTAFFNIPGAKQMADSCGIVIGTSHCEPLLRNNVGEWDVNERGRFNYRTNRQAVQDYWVERLRQVSKSANNMFTIGMRGIHDSSMEGYTTEEEKLQGLQQVIDDQQQLLGKYVGDPGKLMQVFVPYKEVLQLYEKGLRVPEHVTLIWCDDNYGYMTRLSDAEEQKRQGGAGLYYHLSYWGRPHDYLWLTTTQPGLIYHEMRQAYDHNVRKLWIANVHDPKVAGYDLELFLDMAWNIESVTGETLENHYKKWLCRQFGEQVGEQLLPVLCEFYRLCGERRPEFMGWNQVELDKRLYDRGLGQVRNTAFSTTEFGGELDRQIARYEYIATQVEQIAKMVRPELHDAYFAAVQYPVQAAAAHTVKMLEAQRARMLTSGATANGDVSSGQKTRLAVARSLAAYQTIGELTRYYNEEMAQGKWNGLMCDHPRDLPVYWAPLVPFLLNQEEIAELLRDNDALSSNSLSDSGLGKSETDNARPYVARNACEYDATDGNPQIIQMLGHSMKAIALPKGTSLSYQFSLPQSGEYLLTTAVIPTQPNDSGDLRFSVAIDGERPIDYSLKEPFRSEQWKLNVLRGQALRQTKVSLTAGKHRLTIKALDDNIVIDQWLIDSHLTRSFYLIPD